MYARVPTLPTPTTFRAPPLQYLDPSPTNSVVNINNFFRSVKQAGNAELTPEKAVKIIDDLEKSS